jgi:hypothetical protein
VKTVVPIVDRKDFQEWRAAWVERFQPEGEEELHLVEVAALAAWRQRHCAEVEAAKLDRLGRHAAEDFDRAQADRADALGHRLLALLNQIDRGQYDATADVPDTAPVCRELCSFKEGADWLLREWHGLQFVVERVGKLGDLDRLKAVVLTGKRPQDALFDPELRGLLLACAAAADDPHSLGGSFRQARAVGAPRPMYADLVESMRAAEGYGDAASGRAALEAFLAEQVERLEGLKAEWLDEQAELDRDAAVVEASFDASREGASLRRYETACSLDLHRALRELRRLRRESGRPMCGNEPIPEFDEGEGVASDEADPPRVETVSEAASGPAARAWVPSGADAGNEPIAEEFGIQYVTAIHPVPAAAPWRVPLAGPSEGPGGRYGGPPAHR